MPATDITEITLERNCFGCAGSYLVVLRRDGTASYTKAGNARRGTEDQVSKGVMPAGEFDKLAALAVAQGFFALADTYQDPQIQDGASSTIRIKRSGQVKQVFQREEAGPPALRAVESAIDALRERIRFAP